MSSYQNQPATPNRQPTGTHRDRPNRDEPPADEQALREEINETREDLGATVDELSDRMVTQGRRAAVPLAAVGALIISAMITISVVRRRRQSLPRSRSMARRRRRR